LVDTTLRDGEQAPGVYFSPQQRGEILWGLLQLGIQEIEGGIPASSDQAQKQFTYLLSILEEFHQTNHQRTRESSPQPLLIAWNRMNQSDLEASLRAGATNLHISIPSSSLMISKKLSMTPSQVLDELDTLLTWVRPKAKDILLGAEDASRAEDSFILQLAQLGKTHGVRRIRFADTTGCMTPKKTAERCNNLCSLSALPFEFHGHNDFGLAMANSFAALEQGVEAVSCTLGGLGERAGNTPLEEMILSLELLENRSCGIGPEQYQHLTQLCRTIAQWTQIDICPRKPFLGKNVFTHESGIHVDGLLKDPNLYSYLDPSLLGTSHQIVPGVQSGKAGMIWCASILGYALQKNQVEKVRDQFISSLEHHGPQDPWQRLETILSEGAHLDEPT
jgi:homocitrate synthase NifV